MDGMRLRLNLCWFAAALTLMTVSRPSTATPHPLNPGIHRFRSAGVRLWYRVAGVKNGAPIVFLHGGPGEGSQVFQTIGGPELEKRRRIVYLDQRGAGRSDRPKEFSSYSMNTLVDDIERLRRHLGLRHITLLGHSFGAQLATEYAVKYPDHVRALVLAGATPDLLRSLDLQCERLSREDPAAYARATEGIAGGTFPRCDTRKAYNGTDAEQFRLHNLYPDPHVGTLVERIDNTPGLRSSGEAARALFSQGLLSFRFQRAKDIRSPVLMIAGGKDYQAALEPQVEMAGEMRDVEMLVYAKDGHFMFADEPMRFARDVNLFLERLMHEEFQGRLQQL